MLPEEARSENRRENGFLQRVNTAGKGPGTVPKSIVMDTFVTGKQIHFY